MADFATVADAIKTELDSASEDNEFNRQFTSRVLWGNRQLQLDVADTLMVDVLPIDLSRWLLNRGTHIVLMNYHVGIRKRFVESEQDGSGQISDDEVEELAILTDDIAKFFMPKQPNATGHPLTSIQDATILGPRGEQSIETIIRWEDLENLRQFTGYFQLTVQVSE